MLTQPAYRRAHEVILAAARSHDEPHGLHFFIVETLQAVVGFDQWSWASADPLSGLGVSGIGVHDYWSDLARLLLLEQRVGTCESVGSRASTTDSEGWGLSFRQTLEPRGADRRLRRFVQLSLGLLLYGATAAMLVLARLGLDPWDVLHQGLSRTFGLASVGGRCERVPELERSPTRSWWEQ